MNMKRFEKGAVVVATRPIARIGAAVGDRARVVGVDNEGRRVDYIVRFSHFANPGRRSPAFVRLSGREGMKLADGRSLRRKRTTLLDRIRRTSSDLARMTRKLTANPARWIPA